MPRQFVKPGQRQPDGSVALVLNDVLVVANLHVKQTQAKTFKLVLEEVLNDTDEWFSLPNHMQVLHNGPDVTFGARKADTATGESGEADTL